MSQTFEWYSNIKACNEAQQLPKQASFDFLFVGKCIFSGCSRVPGRLAAADRYRKSTRANRSSRFRSPKQTEQGPFHRCHDECAAVAEICCLSGPEWDQRGKRLLIFYERKKFMNVVIKIPCCLMRMIQLQLLGNLFETFEFILDKTDVVLTNSSFSTVVKSNHVIVKAMSSNIKKILQLQKKNAISSR